MLIRTLSALALAAFTAIGCSTTSETSQVRAGAVADGSQMQVDEDGDVQVALGDCPAAVQATIAAHLAGGTVNEIERSPADNYEVEVNTADGQIEFVVAADGTYLGAEDEDDDDGDDDDDDLR